MKKIINKNIILVGPGHLPIPVNGINGWGGIENILTWIIDEFKNRNQEYILINDSNNYKKIVDDIYKKTDSIVHVHYDDYTHNLNKNYRLVATSHSPYHPFIEMWKGGVKTHFEMLFNSIDSYFGQSILSNECALKIQPNLKTGLCRCGIPDDLFSPNRKNKGNKKSLILGKIEPRKNQAFLQNNFSNDLYMDFVGQIADNNFLSQNIGKSKYLGTWSRKEVVSNMSDYSSIILLSNFEGDVVIVKEALASGCSLIISDKAALNLDTSLPFIKIVSNIINKNDFISLVEKTNEENEYYRNDIIKYFNNNFEIKSTVDEYINSLISLYE